jgi:hypothetical protein
MGFSRSLCLSFKFAARLEPIRPDSDVYAKTTIKRRTTPIVIRSFKRNPLHLTDGAL